MTKGFSRLLAGAEAVPAGFVVFSFFAGAAGAVAGDSGDFFSVATASDRVASSTPTASPTFAGSPFSSGFCQDASRRAGGPPWLFGFDQTTFSSLPIAFALCHSPISTSVIVHERDFQLDRHKFGWIVRSPLSEINLAPL
jgi:hypothetical protein